jgi:hypothetical protein
MTGRIGRTWGHPSHIYLLLKTVFWMYCVHCVHSGGFARLLASIVRPFRVRVRPRAWHRSPEKQCPVPSSRSREPSEELFLIGWLPYQTGRNRYCQARPRCRRPANLRGSRPAGAGRSRRRGPGDQAYEGTHQGSPWIRRRGPPAVRSKASAATRKTIWARGEHQISPAIEGRASRTVWSARGHEPSPGLSDCEGSTVMVRGGSPGVGNWHTRDD